MKIDWINNECISLGWVFGKWQEMLKMLNFLVAYQMVSDDDGEGCGEQLLGNLESENILLYLCLWLDSINNSPLCLSAEYVTKIYFN